MRVLVLGTPGVKKTEFIEQVTAVARENKISDGDDTSTGECRIHDLEGRIKQARGGSPRFTSFLDNPDTAEQERILAEEFRSVLDEIGEYEPGPPHDFLLTHGVYYRNKNYFSVLNQKLIREYNPTVVITLIDDFYDITDRINKRERRIKTGSEIEHEEVLTWRNVEIMMADVINGMIDSKTRHFVVAIKHPPKTVYRLLFERSRLRIYVAYPIRTTRTHPDRVKELNRFRGMLTDQFTVFDPRTIDEAPILPRSQVHDEAFITDTNEQGQALLKRLPVSFDEHEPAEMRSLDGVVTIQELNELQEKVENNIEHRDFRLIDQSQAMIGYRPRWGGNAVSTGVKNETEHATRQNKAVYLVHPDQDGSLGEGPFATKGTRFRSTDELKDSLEAWQDEYAETVQNNTWEQR